MLRKFGGREAGEEDEMYGQREFLYPRNLGLNTRPYRPSSAGKRLGGDSCVILTAPWEVDVLRSPHPDLAERDAEAQRGEYTRPSSRSTKGGTQTLTQVCSDPGVRALAFDNLLVISGPDPESHSTSG